VIAFAQKFSRMDDFLTQDDEGVEGADDDRDQGAEYVSKEFRLVNLINKVPPKKKAQGFLAEDWPKEYAQYMACILKVISSKDGAILQFSLASKPDEVFLRFNVNEDPNKIDTIESCVDSSRYFALNVPVPNAENKFATMGIFFDEREDGKNFILEVSQIRSYISKAKEAKIRSAQFQEAKESKEFALSENEILDIKPFKNPKKANKQDDNKEDQNDGGNLFDLAPPKNDTKTGNTKKKDKKKSPEPQAATTTKQNDDLFGNDDWEF